MINNKKNKKAVSPLIGYIILVVIVISMVPVVYTFLKSWTPTSDPMKCPDEVSFFVTETNISGNILTINLKNNGRFDIEGFYFYASNSSEGVGTIDLSKDEYFLPTISGETLIVRPGTSIITLENTKKNPFYTGIDPVPFRFNISDINGDVELVDITPTRMQEHDNRIRRVTCGNAKITKTID